MNTSALQAAEPIHSYLLGPVEAAFWEWEHGSFRTVGVVRLDGRIDSNLMAMALLQLQQRHPKLRAVIVRGNDGRLRYEFDRAVSPITFEIRDCVESEAPFQEETRRLLQSEFPAEGPLIAVTVLRNISVSFCHLILVVHHAIGDGMSTIMLMGDLLTEYARAEASGREVPSPPLRLVAGARAKSSGRWRDRLWLLRRFMRLQREEKRSRLISLPQAPSIPPESQWVLWVFSREETVRLVRRSRYEKTSLLGLLTAAACCGLMDCLPVPEGFFKCQYPFDLRSELEEKVTIEDLGAFASIMNEFYDVSRPASFWDLARRVHTDIQMFVQHEGPSFNYNFLAYLQKVSGWLSSLVKAKRSRPEQPTDQRVTLFVTNYGVANFRDNYGSLRLREGTIFFKGDAVGQWLTMEALVVCHRLNLGFAADCIDPALWEQLQPAVRKYLDLAASAVEPSR